MTETSKQLLNDPNFLQFRIYEQNRYLAWLDTQVEKLDPERYNQLWLSAAFIKASLKRRLRYLKEEQLKAEILSHQEELLSQRAELLSHKEEIPSHTEPSPTVDEMPEDLGQVLEKEKFSQLNVEGLGSTEYQ